MDQACYTYVIFRTVEGRQWLVHPKREGGDTTVVGSGSFEHVLSPRVKIYDNNPWQQPYIDPEPRKMLRPTEGEERARNPG